MAKNAIREKRVSRVKNEEKKNISYLPPDWEPWVLAGARSARTDQTDQRYGTLRKVT
jgi:hypothetical protein